MSTLSPSDINVTGESGFESLIGKVLLCRRIDGKHFASKLVAISGDFAVFQTRDGTAALNRISDIETAIEIPGRS